MNTLTGAPELERTLTPAHLQDQTSEAGATPGSESGNDELDRPITTRWLLKFTAPTIVSYVLYGAFGMVDGVFAARVIAPLALAAVNIVWPWVAFAMAVCFTLSMGGAALVGKKLGEGKVAEARANFSLLTVVSTGISLLLSGAALLFPDALMNVLGADEALRPLVLEYLVPITAMLPLAMLGFFVQQFFVTEGKPQLGFVVTAAGGVVNVGLNFLFIWHLGMGLTGAALATGIGWAVPAFIGGWFFARNKAGVLRFGRPAWDLKALVQSSVNGSSEMITMLAGSITLVMMNNIVIRIAGPEGVAAVAIIFVGQGLLMQAFLGYSYGVAPIVSFNYGKGDTARLRKTFKRSLWIIVAAAAGSIILGWALAHPLTRVYVPAGTEIYEMAVLGLRLGLLGMVFTAINGFASVLFTALNNGVVSGILSVFRTLVFVVLMLSLLPSILDLNGVWLALPAAELLALGMSVWYLARKAKQYGYA